jgi:hypothetical protein
VLLALTHILALLVENLLKEISSLTNYFYSNVLNNVHLVLTLIKTMHVYLVKVVLNVLVHLKPIVLAVTCSGDKISITLLKLLLVTGKVSSNLLPIKSKLLVVNKLPSKVNNKVKRSKVNVSKHVAMVTSWLETIKNAYLALHCAKHASMNLISALLQKLVMSNSWVNSMPNVQKVWSQLKLLLVIINGTSVVVLKIVLLTLALLKKKVTKNFVMLVKITLTGILLKLENVILLLQNVLLL